MFTVTCVVYVLSQVTINTFNRAVTSFTIPIFAISQSVAMSTVLYPGCQRFFLRGFRCQFCLYCDPREKPLEQNAISLRAPRQ